MPLEKKQHEEFMSVVEDFKKLNDEMKASKEKDKAEYKEQLDKMQDHVDKMEVKLNRPALETKDQKDLDKFVVKDEVLREAYRKFLMLGENHLTPEETKAITSQKALISSDDNQGGFFVPVERSNQVIEFLRETSPIRQIATVIPINSKAITFPSEDDAQDFAAEWVGEQTTPAKTDTGKVGQETLTAYMISAKPEISSEFLEDSAIPAEEWVNRKLAERFAITENLAFVTGDGINKPEGFMTKSGLTEVVSGDANLLTADGIIDLRYSPKTLHGQNGTWVFNRKTLRDVRKLKDADNQYLWQPGLTGTQPSILLERPWLLGEDMPDIAANAFPIAFGDFRRGFWIVDRRGMTMLRDPFSAKPFIQFYTTKRVGGQVVLKEAIHKQKVAA